MSNNVNDGLRRECTKEIRNALEEVAGASVSLVQLMEWASGYEEKVHTQANNRFEYMQLISECLKNAPLDVADHLNLAPQPPGPFPQRRASTGPSPATPPRPPAAAKPNIPSRPKLGPKLRRITGNRSHSAPSIPTVHKRPPPRPPMSSKTAQSERPAKPQRRNSQPQTAFSSSPRMRKPPTSYSDRVPVRRNRAGTVAVGSGLRPQPSPPPVPKSVGPTKKRLDTRPKSILKRPSISFPIVDLRYAPPRKSRVTFVDKVEEIPRRPTSIPTRTRAKSVGSSLDPPPKPELPKHGPRTRRRVRRATVYNTTPVNIDKEPPASPEDSSWFSVNHHHTTCPANGNHRKPPDVPSNRAQRAPSPISRRPSQTNATAPAACRPASARAAPSRSPPTATHTGKSLYYSSFFTLKGKKKYFVLHNHMLLWYKKEVARQKVTAGKVKQNGSYNMKRCTVRFLYSNGKPALSVTAFSDRGSSSILLKSFSKERMTKWKNAMVRMGATDGGNEAAATDTKARNRREKATSCYHVAAEKSSEMWGL